MSRHPRIQGMKWSLGLPLINSDTSAPSPSLQSISGVPNVPGSELMSRLPNVVALYGDVWEESSRWSPDVGHPAGTLRTPMALSTV